MDVLSGLRNPDHTGENRCVPCTAVNLALVLVGGGLLVLAGFPLLAGGVAALGAAAVWLHGYVVPYTPRFAPRLVALSPLPERWFADRTADGSLADSEGVSGEEALAALAEAGIVRAEGEAVVLDRSFETEWHEEMASLADASPAELRAAVAETDDVPDVSAVRSEGKQWFVAEGDHALIPLPILVAELAAVRTLPSSLGPARVAAAPMLRQFLDTCPVCDADLVPSSTTSCCGSNRYASETRVCPACQQRVFTIPDADEGPADDEAGTPSPA